VPCSTRSGGMFEGERKGWLSPCLSVPLRVLKRAVLKLPRPRKNCGHWDLADFTFLRIFSQQSIDLGFRSVVQCKVVSRMRREGIRDWYQQSGQAKWDMRGMELREGRHGVPYPRSVTCVTFA